ncbi:16531_t:CDS:2 [Racocetra persica]|uniref:16531_t:CDS:1 n=1 Tax=Racocetra persica TaxID=160502 RepID=A0ACA9LAA6_9GLOM|nr:16531_t:CDS:2 [Racocetra persica]
MIPDPQGYLDLQKLLHKKQAPDADNKLELSEKLEDGTSEWKKDPEPINPKPLEEPKAFELDFLRRLDSLVRKYLIEYTHTPELLRFNKVVDEFYEKGDVGKSEDYAFDHFRLIDHKAGVSDADYKLYREKALKRDFVIQIREKVERLEMLLSNVSELTNRSDENIELIIESLKGSIDHLQTEGTSIDDAMKTRIEKLISGFGKEMARRQGKKEEYERYERERQADRQRLENIERNNSNLQTQLNNAISNNNTGEQNRLRQRIVESENEARRLRENISDYENRLRNLENRRSGTREQTSGSCASAKHESVLGV